MEGYMNLKDIPGTICSGVDGSLYVVGATEKYNEEFRARVRNYDCEALNQVKEIGVEEAIKRGIIVELKTGITKIEYGSDAYNDILKVKGMPDNIFGGDYGSRMQKMIGQCMNDFYAGKIDDEELKNQFNELCSAMRIHCCGERYTNGQNAEDNQKIVNDVYEIFAKENARAARNANYEEGRKYSTQNNIGGRDDDIVYYNSDYYYKCVETKDIIRNAANAVTDNWATESINFDEVESNSILTLDGGFDFNSGWNFSCRNQVARGSIEDENIEPPEGFKFFYKESSKSGKSILKVWGNDSEKSTAVPYYDSDDSRYKGQIYRVSDIIKFKEKDTDSYMQYNDFMKNITVFTRKYSLVSGICYKVGNFIPEFE